MIMVNNIVTHEFGKRGSTPIIFIHGFPFDYQMWMNQINFLQTSFHCIAYDIRGLGQSNPGDGQFTMEMFADDLFDIISELKLDKPVICGLSMGGYIALRAVERDQSKFGGLILCDTKAEADDNEGRLKRAAGIKRINGEDGAEGYVKDFLPNCFSDITMTEQKEMYDEVLERALLNSPKGIKGCLLAMAGRTDTTAALGKIEIPTLVICGSSDKFVTPDAMRIMAGKIPNSEFASAPRAGHVPPLENPQFVNDVISGFIKKRSNV